MLKHWFRVVASGYTTQNHKVTKLMEQELI
jgi:hypothetical protein